LLESKCELLLKHDLDDDESNAFSVIMLSCVFPIVVVCVSLLLAFMSFNIEPQIWPWEERPEVSVRDLMGSECPVH